MHKLLTYPSSDYKAWYRPRSTYASVFCVGRRRGGRHKKVDSWQEKAQYRRHEAKASGADPPARWSAATCRFVIHCHHSTGRTANAPSPRMGAEPGVSLPAMNVERKSEGLR